MKLPTVAPLTGREAKAARAALPHFVKAKQVVSEDNPHRGEFHEFADAMIDALEQALAEYEARPLIRRLIPPPAEHRTRLRQWMIEVQGYAEARLRERSE